MSLPKIQYPIFSLILPSDGSKVQFRPFTVKEEKLLLIAQESEETADRLRAIRQIINNCAIDLNKDIGLLPSFDLEYFFLKIRSVSIGNIVHLRYKDNIDNKIYEFDVNLDDIEITKNKDHVSTIELSNSLGVIMRYPTVEILAGVKDKDETLAGLTLVKKCIMTIYDSETTYDADNYTIEELSEFVEALSVKDFEKIVNFFETMPILKYDLHYKDSEGTEKTITLQGINDFFQ